MTNEPSLIICECSDIKVCIQDNISDNHLHQMDQTESTKASNILDGCNIAIIPIIPTIVHDGRIDETTESLSIYNLIYSFINRSSKRIDDELDKISLSSDLEELTNNNYNLTHKKNNHNDSNLTNSANEKESIRKRGLNKNEENEWTLDKYFVTKNVLSKLNDIHVIVRIKNNFTIQLSGNVINNSFDRKFESNKTNNKILDSDNIVFCENKLPIGYIDNVLGKIENLNLNDNHINNKVFLISNLSLYTKANLKSKQAFLQNINHFCFL